MPKKRLQIKNSQVKKNLRWHILRLLRLNSGKRQKLIDKFRDMYMGYWQVNNELIDINLNTLVDEGLIKYSDKYETTKKGLDALGKRERNIEEYHVRRLSKEACAKYSLWGNVGLSALEFIIGFLSGSIGLIADAVHTGIDIGASTITWIGIKINREAQAALPGGIILCGIGAFIAFESITKILKPAKIQFQAVALATILNTSVPSAYYDKRVKERQKATIKFWKDILPNYQVYISEITVEELENTRSDTLKRRLKKLIKGFEVLKSNKRIRDLAKMYIENRIFSERYIDDALHVAIASFYEISYLISWNFEHLVKVRTRRWVNSVNILRGFREIEIISPQEL